MKKRFLGYVLTALLLLTMLPTAALAVEEPISIGEKGYETLQNALDAIGPGEEGTITVNEDISVDEALTIGERKSVAIVPGAETVKVSFGKDGALTAEAGAKLTLGSEAGTSELVLDGGADWPYTSPAGQSSLWESLYVSAEVQNNGVKRTSPLITASGTLEMYAGVTLQNTHNNRTNGDNGGAVKVQSGGLFTMFGGCIKNNLAENGGAVAVLDGRFVMHDGSLEANAAYRKGDSGPLGGAVYADSGAVEILGGSISGNEARNGGGAIGVEGGPDSGAPAVILKNCILSGNGCYSNSGQGGGALYLEDSSAELTGVIIDGNTAGLETNAYGGGIHVDNSSLTATDTQIINNVASLDSDPDNGFLGVGGGLMVNNKSTVRLINCNVKGNKSGYQGGGFQVQKESSLYITGGSVNGNKGLIIGGIAFSGTVLEVDGSSITGNIAEQHAGGIRVDSGSAVLRDALVTGNEGSYGGGLLVFSQVLLEGDTQLSGNTASNGGDGVYVADGGEFSVQDEVSIAPDNDVCLESGTFITVSDSFSGATSQSPVKITSQDVQVENETAAGTKLVYYTEAAGGAGAAKSAAQSQLFVPSGLMLAEYPELYIGKSEAAGQTDCLAYVGKPALAGTICIRPADMTVYMGGDGGYDGVVDGEGNIVGSGSLPMPGFTFDGLPEGSDPTGLSFTGADGSGWIVELYPGLPENAQRPLYTISAVGGSHEVRIQFTRPDGSVATEDEFTVGSAVNQTLAMSIYPGSLDGVTASFGGETYGIVLGKGSLTVRGTTQNAEYGYVGAGLEPDLPGVSAAEGTTYTINGSEVASSGSVALLFDDIIETEGGDGANKQQLREAALEELGGGSWQFEYKYLDLVDRENGDAWVRASGDVTVYWPIPDGAPANAQFRLLHFKGLHRSGSDGKYELEEIAVRRSADGEHLYFSIGSGGFSPFVLAWSSGSVPTPTPTPLPEPETGPVWLNTEDHYAYIIGYEDGTVRPDGTVTRAEVATIFYRLLTDKARAAFRSEAGPYTDVRPGDWYNTAVSTLSAMGILGGYEDGSFRPNAPITRAEFAKIAVSFFERTDAAGASGFTDVPKGAWYADFVAAAAQLGLIEGYGGGVFRPEAGITRAEACAIVNRTLGRTPDSGRLLPEAEMNTWPDNPRGAWYYADIQEATNSHAYKLLDGAEQWTEKLPERDWDAE